MYDLLYLSIVFSYSVNNIQLSNILFYPFLVYQLYNSKGKLKIIKSIFPFVCLFIIMIFVSVFAFSIKINKINFRTLVQLAFAIQYLVLCIEFKIDKDLMEKRIILFAKLLSFFILFVFISKGVFFNINTLFTASRLYGNGILPGWPNSTALPMIFSTWILLKNKTEINFDLLLFSVASILTTSRMAIVAITILWLYFWIIKPNLIIFKGKIRKKSIIWFCFALFILFLLGFVLMRNESFAYRLGVTYDRENIFIATIEYIKKSPFIGYGGNTIEQLYGVIPNNSILYNWGHTHNAFLEIALRYGVIALFLFIVFFIQIYRKQKTLDNKIILLILIMLATSQILIRNFTFLLYLSLLNVYNSNEKNKKEGYI